MFVALSSSAFVPSVYQSLCTHSSLKQKNMCIKKHTSNIKLISAAYLEGDRHTAA